MSNLQVHVVIYNDYPRYLITEAERATESLVIERGFTSEIKVAGPCSC